MFTEYFEHLDYLDYLKQAEKLGVPIPKAFYTKEKQMEPLFNFGDALKALKESKKVARMGWNGKNMYIFITHAATYFVDTLPNEPYISMKTAQGRIQPGWLASQADMLAEDWQILREHDAGDWAPHDLTKYD